MSDTHFDDLRSEQLSSLALWRRETAEDNSLQMERVRRNLKTAREKELTPRQREIVALYYDRGLSMRQIAYLLHVHPSTVSRTLQRAKRRLEHSLRYTF